MGFDKLVFGKKDVQEIINVYGSPVYVYDEEILRKRCREMRNLLKYPRFRVNYSAKANTNVELLKIVCSEGLDVDGMSPGEMYLEMKAGFTPDRITFIGNNVSVRNCNLQSIMASWSVLIPCLSSNCWGK